MTKQKKANIAMGFFLTACILPAAGMIFLPPEPTAANQTLAAPPALFQPDGSFNTRVLNDTADYVADHLGFRQELITAHAVMNAAVFHVSSEDSVLLGKNGWLFYQETLDDYLHTKPLSQRQLFAAAHTLSLLSEYSAAQGARLYFTVAPNKASLYPEQLPNVGQPLEGESNLERLVPLLEAEGVNYVDLFTPLDEQEEYLYYKTDSHWTDQGAALAHDTLIAAMDKKDQTAFFDGPTQPGPPHLGDLFEMLYPALNQPEDTKVYQRPFSFSYVRQPRSPEDQRIETECADRSGNLLMFRDSFGNTLHSYMADAFGSALFSRSMPYQMSLLSETGADTVLIEIVERNLEWLTERAPVFPAPQRQFAQVPAPGGGDASITVQESGQLPGYLCLEGWLSAAPDENSPIYVRLADRVYEASPTGSWEDGTPFTLYVEQSAYAQTACVLYFANGTLCSSESTTIQEG